MSLSARDDLERSKLLYDRGEQISFNEAVERKKLTRRKLTSWKFNKESQDLYFEFDERNRVTGYTEEGAELLK
jgi:hypothetical protein